MSDSEATVGEETSSAAAPRRTARATALVALGVGVAVAALTYSVVALPLYLLAEIDADGLDRPVVRDAFFGVAVPAGLIAGLVAGIAAAVVLVRGGRLPTDRTSFYER